MAAATVRKVRSAGDGVPAVRLVPADRDKELKMARPAPAAVDKWPSVGDRVESTSTLPVAQENSRLQGLAAGAATQPAQLEDRHRRSSAELKQRQEHRRQCRNAYPGVAAFRRRHSRALLVFPLPSVRRIAGRIVRFLPAAIRISGIFSPCLALLFHFSMRVKTFYSSKINLSWMQIHFNSLDKQSSIVTLLLTEMVTVL